MCHSLLSDLKVQLNEEPTRLYNIKDEMKARITVAV